MKIGDYVKSEINGTVDRGWIIGEADYSEGDVFVIASGLAIGMPVNKRWLTIDGESSTRKAAMLRGRYLKCHPGRLTDLVQPGQPEQKP